MTTAGSTLTVVTYNIRAAIGPGPFPAVWWREVEPERLRRIAQVIADLQPDVVALQEVALMTLHGVVQDQAREIGRLTGMDDRYASVAHFPIIEPESGEVIGATFWGNAILSRHPIGASRTVALPAPGDDELVEPAESALEFAGLRYGDAGVGAREPRCALVADVQLPTGDAHFVSTHLSHVGAGQRRAQAARIAETVADFGSPVIVAGDLNAPIVGPELEPLRTSLTDAFAASGVPPGDAARASCGPLAIDHVLMRGLAATTCAVVHQAGDASDHWPVLATLAV